MPKEPTQLELEFAEARAAMKTGKVVIVIFYDGRRDIVNKIWRERDGEGGFVMHIETHAGHADERAFASLRCFENVRDAQRFLFDKVAA